jgi:hypothetical protein
LERFTKRANTTDFDRFKVMINRKQRSYKVNHLAAKLNGSAKKAPAKASGKAQAKAPAKGKK